MAAQSGWIAVLVATLHSLIAQYGLIGFFLAAVLANATIFFGVPFEAVLLVVAATNTFNPILLGLAGGLGAAFGELTSYFLGLGSVKLVEKVQQKDLKLVGWMKDQINQKGMIAIYLMLLVPIPFDLVGIAAGMVKMDAKRFFIATFLGKSTRYIILAFAASVGVKIILAYFGASN